MKNTTRNTHRLVFVFCEQLGFSSPVRYIESWCGRQETNRDEGKVESSTPLLLHGLGTHDPWEDSPPFRPGRCSRTRAPSCQQQQPGPTWWCPIYQFIPGDRAFSFRHKRSKGSTEYNISYGLPGGSAQESNERAHYGVSCRQQQKQQQQRTE